MGISGLLPQLKSITKNVHIKSYAGQTVAIDGYAWLHKGVFCCAQELCLGQPTDRYVRYCMKKIKLLLHFKVIPFVVFDGADLPAKAGTERERESKREEGKRIGKQLLESANRMKGSMHLKTQMRKKQADARQHFVKGCDVTPFMAYCWIKELRALNVSFVVAPYEADAQLAHLSSTCAFNAVVLSSPKFGTCVFDSHKCCRCSLIRRLRLPALRLQEGTDRCNTQTCTCIQVYLRTLVLT